jgi:hypothetical protein
MQTFDRTALTRRAFLGGTAGSALLAALPGGTVRAATHDYRLTVGIARVPLPAAHTL